MIRILNDDILLSTEETSLVLTTRFHRKLTTAYYGARLISEEEIPSLIRNYSCNQGTELSLDDGSNCQLTEDQLRLDVSVMGHGDYFQPSLIMAKGDSTVFDFVFEKAEVIEPTLIPGLPTPHDASQELVVTLRDALMATRLELHYVVYEKENVIGRYLVIVNEDDKPLCIRKAMSYQIALINQEDRLFTTYGHWAGELNQDTLPLRHGRTVIESLCGSSSARHNPFFFLEEDACGLNHGNVYGFNLVYSGNHEESLEMDSFDNIRIQAGIASTGFEKILAKEDSFATPMGVMTFSDKGRNGLARNMQTFVMEHIIPVNFKTRERPIVYNNWEATGPKFNRHKLVSLMKSAKALGIELFVLDDGWFSTRDDDAHGLGDWTVNTRKLSGGLKAVSEEAGKLGMKFGIWVEPEMVNDDTDLYKEHPDWIIHDGIHQPLKGRHQYTLNLTKKEVQDYLVKSVSDVINSGKISYVKWDYNRNMSDVPQGFSSFYHDYILGLYQVLDRLVRAFPDVLFENCASGGNRFDLGMLSYFAQSWMSDDTDSYQRETIQTNALYGYPLSVMSNHVAAKTSNQLLRKTDLDTKYDVAQYGVLGYELDLDDLFAKDKEAIKAQVAFYKEHRRTLQFGQYLVVQDAYKKNDAIVEALGDDEAIVTFYHSIQRPNPKEGHLRAFGLEKDALYTYETRQHSINIHRFGGLVNYVSPVHLKEDGVLVSILAKKMVMKGEKDSGIASGSLLASQGPVLSQEWSGVGYNDNVRLFHDFGTRSYLIRKKK